MTSFARETRSSGRLKGLRVLVLRPEGQDEELAAMLRSEGAEAVVIPAVRIVPVPDPSHIDRAIQKLTDFDWLVFTSVNGVDAFVDRLGDRREGLNRGKPRIATIGPATGARLEAAGIEAGWMPSAYTTRALAAELPMESDDTAGGRRSEKPRVCLFRADIASPDLEQTLSVRGFDVERVSVYGTETVNTEGIRQALGSVDAVALTSASIAASFARACEGMDLGRVRIFSIGPATSQACLARGLPVEAEARVHTMRGLVDVLNPPVR